MLFEEQYFFNLSEYYINFISTHFALWSGFDITVLDSIYLALL